MLWGVNRKVYNACFHLTRSLREPGGPCTMSMEVSESRMERVNFRPPRFPTDKLHLLQHNMHCVLLTSQLFLEVLRICINAVNTSGITML